MQKYHCGMPHRLCLTRALQTYRPSPSSSSSSSSSSSIFSQQVAVSQKRCKTGPKLLLLTNRKSHTLFRLVQKSTTLDDLERPICTLLQKRCTFWSPTQKSESKYTHIIRGTCSPITLVSGDIRFM